MLKHNSLAYHNCAQWLPECTHLAHTRPEKNIRTRARYLFGRSLFHLLANDFVDGWIRNGNKWFYALQPALMIMFKVVRTIPTISLERVRRCRITVSTYVKTLNHIIYLHALQSQPPYLYFVRAFLIQIIRIKMFRLDAFRALTSVRCHLAASSATPNRQNAWTDGTATILTNHLEDKLPCSERSECVLLMY